MIIEIIALGESKNQYQRNENQTIGVNDVFSFMPVDTLIIIDPPNRFSEERKKIILSSTPKEFLVSFKEWQSLRSDAAMLKLCSGRGSLKELDTPNVYCYSNNSAFVACVVAYKKGAKKIIMHGADFKNHPALCKINNFARVLSDFKNLRTELQKRGVELFVSSGYSALSNVLQVLK